MSVGAVVACCALAAACTSEPPQHTFTDSRWDDAHRISDRAPNETRLRGCRKGISGQHAEQDRLYQAVATARQLPLSKPPLRAHTWD